MVPRSELELRSANSVLFLVKAIKFGHPLWRILLNVAVYYVTFMLRI